MDLLIPVAAAGALLGAWYVRRRTLRSRARARFVVVTGGEDGSPEDRSSVLLEYFCGGSFPPPASSVTLVVLTDGASRMVRREGGRATVRFGWIQPRRLARRLARFEHLGAMNLAAGVRDGTRWSVATPTLQVSAVLGMAVPDECARLRELAASHARWL